MSVVAGVHCERSKDRWCNMFPVRGDKGRGDTLSGRRHYVLVNAWVSNLYLCVSVGLFLFLPVFVCLFLCLSLCLYFTSFNLYISVSSSFSVSLYINHISTSLFQSVSRSLYTCSGISLFLPLSHQVYLSGCIILAGKPATIRVGSPAHLPSRPPARPPPARTPARPPSPARRHARTGG